MSEMTEEKIVDLALNRIDRQKVQTLYKPDRFDLLLMEANSFGNMNDVTEVEEEKPKAPTYIYSQGNDGEEGVLVLQQASKQDAVSSDNQVYSSVLTNLNSEIEELKGLHKFDHKYLAKAGLFRFEETEIRAIDEVQNYTHGVFIDGLDRFKHLVRSNNSFSKMLKLLATTRRLDSSHVMRHAVLLIDTSKPTWERYLIQSYEDVRNILDL